MLESKDLAIFKRAFSRADHEFVNGFVYLSEDAITDRIEEVDPSWTFEIQRIERVGDQAIVCARMTIKGISREGVGMQKVNEKAGEPDKGAATDALKRCARLFGIGRYLLDAPKEGSGFDKWLAEQQKASTVKPDAPRPTPQPAPSASPSQTEPTPAPAASPEPEVVEPVQIGSLDMASLLRRAYNQKIVTGKVQFNTLVRELQADGSIRDASTSDAVIDALKKAVAAKEFEHV